MFFYHKECKNCFLYIIIQKITLQAESETCFQIWFFPRFGGKNGGVPSMRMQVILDSSFRPPGFSPYMGREERRVQGLDCKRGCVWSHLPWTVPALLARVVACRNTWFILNNNVSMTSVDHVSVKINDDDYNHNDNDDDNKNSPHVAK